MGRTTTNSTSRSEPDDQGALYAEILARLDKIDDNIKRIDTRMQSMEQSLQYHSETVAELKTDMSSIKSVIPHLKASVEEHEIQQANKMLEIQGLPHRDNEDRIAVISKLGSIIGVPITKENIDLTYRNKNKKSLVVKFLQTHISESVLKAFKAKAKSAKVTASDFGFRTGPTSPTVYVNEYLLYDTRNLFHKTRQFQKTNEFRFSWTINQKIYLRKEEGSSSIRITCEQDLDNLRSSS